VVVGVLLALWLAWPQAAAAQPAEGISEEKIALGKKLYSAGAGCAVCHGKLAKGVPGMTSDLTDGVWKYAEQGTYEAVVAVIMSGLSKEQTGKMVMPSKDAKKLTDEQIEALAAYLWSLNPKAE
jgi:mono/diheme cytochrome c family protein